NLAFSKQEYSRYQELAKTGAGTVQRAQQAEADLREKTATLKHNQAVLASAEKQIEVLWTQRAKAQATLLHDRAVLDQARLNLGYTVIKAPVDGAVGDRAARVGLYVHPGTHLITIVPVAAVRYSRCCRPKTPQGISPRSCSACRSRSCSIRPLIRCSIGYAPVFRWRL